MFGGLILDVVIAFVWKSSVRFFKQIQSAKWPRTTAAVLQVIAREADCPEVEIKYRYQQPLVSEAVIPFFSLNAAKRYGDLLVVKSAIIVRIKPNDLSKSWFFDEDQNLSQ